MQKGRNLDRFALFITTRHSVLLPSFLPVVCNPWCLAHIAESTIAPTFQRIRRIDLAMEDHDLRTSRYKRITPVVGRPFGNAMVFVACTPCSRPVGQLALLVQYIRQKSLFVAETGTRFSLRSTELCKNIGVRTKLETIDRRISRHTPWSLPVMNDEELTRMLEERIHVVRDDDIHIQKQGCPLESVQISFEGCQLFPTTLRQTIGQA